MKAWEVHANQGLEALVLVDRSEPQLKAGQVLIKMRAWSLNYRDLLTVKGAYGSRQKLPFIPLSDGVGEVVAIAAGVTRVSVGDRVAGIFMQTWRSGELSAEKSKSALGGAIDGVLAEYVALHENGVVHVPAYLTDEEAATLPCAAVTAWHALIVSGQLKPGDTVLTLGTGGASIFALQFAKLVGARVIITSSSDEKLARSRLLGASDGINYLTTPDWDQAVWNITHKVGVDHVVEVGGAGTLNRSLRAVRMGGQVSLFGVLSGSQGDISTVTILQKNIRLQGIYVGSRDMFEAMNRAIALHQLKPVVDRVFLFTETREALRYLESGAHFGKVCLKLS